MNDNTDSELTALSSRLRQILLELAPRQETLALAEAAAVP